MTFYKKKKRRPDPINALITGAVERHGIGHQITAAMIVKRGNELLDQLIDPIVRNDVRVVSFKKNELHVVCRHPQARHMIEAQRVTIADHMEQLFPSASISRIFCRIDPHILDSRSEIQ